MRRDNAPDTIIDEEVIAGIKRVALYRPWLATLVVVLSVLTAMFEGIGLSFLVPILREARVSSTDTTRSTFIDIFEGVYATLSVPFTLEYILVGVGLVMVARYSLSFLADYVNAILKYRYLQELQSTAFEAAVETEIQAVDELGTDHVLNTIVTQSKFGEELIGNLVQFVRQLLLSVMYLGIALALAPRLTLGTLLVLGGIAMFVRRFTESGLEVGDNVADANENVQSISQAGIQGIRDVKLFNLVEELRAEFESAVDRFASWSIILERNKSILNNFYQLAIALAVFALIYAAIRFLSLSLASLGVFLFAMFRLGPRIGTLNNLVYGIEGKAPHVLRTQQLINDLEARQQTSGTRTPPADVDELVFENVTFGYEDGDAALSDVSFRVERGEFVAFVGPSGAGKSTVMSLISRLYLPDEGTIEVDGTPIREFDPAAWRGKIAVVRQKPFIFNETLRDNVTVGKRDATTTEIERACELARVTEFVDELPNGYETVLGDDGVRLSGGQRQRVAIARALLKDADVLILDEATSELDTALEEQVHANIESMRGDRLVLVNAHRLSTVVGADCIYTMENGRIAESGTHEELLARQGTYAELHDN